MSVFTCISCNVAFREHESQRQHYKTDWHRYNLKRKVVGLPPVTAEEFQLRVLKLRELDADNNKDSSMCCTTCHKAFNGLKSYDNHLQSKKHKERLAHPVVKSKQVRPRDFEGKVNEEEVEVHDDDDVDDSDLETDSEIEEISSDEWNDDDANNPINKNNCLFCNHHSRSMVVNLHHMTEAHSFFVPDIEFCVDLRGMLLYLGAKVNDGHLCLWCGEKGKTFVSTPAVQKHMIDKGHCKVLHEGEALAEYSDFYDYSSSYPDNEEGNDSDAEIVIPVLDDSDYQLVLPSGSVIGHRSLMRYYKQNLDPKKGQLVVHKVNQVLSSYKALGYTPLHKEIVQRKARDLHFMKRVQQKFSMQVGCKANKLQRHFRQQVNF